MNISRKKHYGVFSPLGFLYPDTLCTSKERAIRWAKEGDDVAVELRIARIIWPTKRKASKKA